MAVLQRLQIPLGITLFGIVSAACFFFPGLKYYRQRRRWRRVNMKGDASRPLLRE